MKKICFLTILICLTYHSISQPLSAASADSLRTIQAARGVIERFTGGKTKVTLSLSLRKDAQGHDQYTISNHKGTLLIEGSSGVALCRGFYSWVRQNKAGMCSWSGSVYYPERMRLPERPIKVTSPYRDHQYLNVVTFGYTCPYWDQERWDKELDWMALHGIDMPLDLIGQEYVYRLVFKKLGLSDTEIDQWEVGPAHLPWMRMGNLAGSQLDGPLTKSWNQQQVDLQKHLLSRMRTLGMKPIFPAFGGFVPKAYAKHYDEDITPTGWDWMPEAQRNFRLSPGSEHFVKIGRLFIQTWDSIFGPGKYYLSDSFNEMTVPSDKKLLTQFGDSIYKSIVSANHDAVWVMQGWTLGYQRNEWGDGRFEALVKNVPNNRFMMLDMATDYNHCSWNFSYNWEYYPNFYGKDWVWSVIPNMGGKTALTGVLEYYANGRLDAWRSANRGNLTGYGMAPEGIENNEMIYELLSDGGWTRDSIDLKAWLNNYAECRYGIYAPRIDAYYDGLLHSVYNSFEPHPRFGWQLADCASKGNVHQSEVFYRAVEMLFNGKSLSKSPLYLNDLAEAAGLYCAGKAEQLAVKIDTLQVLGQQKQAAKLKPRLWRLMKLCDEAMACHPNYDLRRWEEMAANQGTTPQQKSDYKRNARRIVTTWITPHIKRDPVNDYSARVWSGLISDFYLPRLRLYLETPKKDRTQTIVHFEQQWVDSCPKVSPMPKHKGDTYQYLQCIVKEASGR